MTQANSLFFVYIFLLFIFGCSDSSDIVHEKKSGDAEKKYYGIEINGILCGFLESTVIDFEKDGQKMKQVEQNRFLMQTLFGFESNTEVYMLSYVNRETGRCNFCSIEVSQGSSMMKAKIIIKGNMAYITPFTSENPIEVEITPDVIFGEDELLHYLKRDFSTEKTKERQYSYLDPIEGKVREFIFTKTGIEEIETMGKKYQTVIFDLSVRETGLKAKWWCDLANSEILKFELINQKLFRTDHTVADKIKVTNMDKSNFTKSNVYITDINNISYMKLDVKLESTGIHLTSADLNIAGQRFTGTIKDNLIEGIFEIEHKKYNGDDAPAFPQDYSNEEFLKKYLKPGRMIEVDDPVLIKKAHELTQGAKNTWEAACRLSSWVAENITYAVSGGGSARKTYDMKTGACESQSCLLAAFCRAVNIPARVVFGAMYVPNHGGGFGKHGWNELFMGKAGWISVDVTAFEEDFLDSGHIRIAEFQSPLTSFNAKKIEILDYKIKTINKGNVIGTGCEEFQKYIGNYRIPTEKKIVKVTAKNGDMVVEIPEKAIISLNKPDKNGCWYGKDIKHYYFTFKENSRGNVIYMRLHQIMYLQKKSGYIELEGYVPENFKPFLGRYYFPDINVIFRVFYKDERLVLFIPDEKEIIELYPTDNIYKWLDMESNTLIVFEHDDKGIIVGMNIITEDLYKRIRLDKFRGL